MVISTSRFAYEDCYSVLNQAAEDDKGARVRMEDYKAANFLRMRIHQARRLIRDENAKTYEDGHPMHGRSIYDKLVVRIRKVDGTFWLYVEPTVIAPHRIQQLSNIIEGAFEEIKPLPMPEPQRQLTFVRRRI